MKTAAVIPARYGSTRFPGKPLVLLAGKPLVLHVADRAREAKRVEEVIIATDDERIRKVAEDYGVRAIMTSPEAPSGSDRIAEVARELPDLQLIVNVQGDEPLMPPQVIDQALEALEKDWDCAVATAMIPIRREEDFLSPHVVKVVCDRQQRALYFSRSPVPGFSRATRESRQFYYASRLGGDGSPFFGFKHFGLYAYKRQALLEFVKMAPTPLEKLECLEQLRFLENNYTIRLVETELDSIGVDTPEDMATAEELIQKRKTL